MMYLNELMNACHMSRAELSARSNIPESTGSLHSRTVAGAPCSSRRSASLLRPQGALGFGPPKPLAWDRSLPPPVEPKPTATCGG